MANLQVDGRCPAGKSFLNWMQDAPSAVLMFHAELDGTNDTSRTAETALPTKYSTFLASRPQQLEKDAISLITDLQVSFPALRCHIVHLSAAEALPQIRQAREAGLKLTVETCFHYLCLSSDEIPDGQPQFKCCPPIRESVNREKLWDALKDGLIDFVVSDHSPCIAELKRLDSGNIMEAWGGISTLGKFLS
jgi:allantoinase